jgi:hypothetical protein
MTPGTGPGAKAPLIGKVQFRESAVVFFGGVVVCAGGVDFVVEGAEVDSLSVGQRANGVEGGVAFWGMPFVLSRIVFSFSSACIS